MVGGKGYEMGGEIKKGPWKAEEDEVLMNHVNKYGPRDWSSIRSKGLLQRTGKSCRLRWVNKLRPNLKTGVKFSAEEERIVIELQAEFGNKWAKIATFLPGRTDNDVKNFWSSRQKRLARILQTPAAPSPPKSQHNNRGAPIIHQLLAPEAPKITSSTEESSSSKNQSCSSSYVVHSPKPFKMVPLPELLLNPSPCHYEQNLLDLEFNANDNNLCQDPFPQIQPLQTELPMPLALESQEDLMTQLGEPNFFEVFGSASVSEIGNLQLHCAPDFGTVTDCGAGETKENDNPSTPDSFIDDFPMDMFDHIDPLPSPSDW